MCFNITIDIHYIRFFCNVKFDIDDNIKREIMSNESKFALRLPTDLYNRIRLEADKLSKSINEFIVQALTEYIDFKDETESRLAELERRLEQVEQFTTPPAPGQ
jgi:hypothetical protein